MSLHVVLCDDEAKFRTPLKHVVEKELQLHGIDYRISEQVSGEALLKSKTDTLADLFFLDIELAELDGLSLAKKIRQTNKKAIIIFVTAFPDFVFQGYEVRAFNYILKPYQEEKICSVLQAALAEIDALEPLYFMVEQKAGATKVPLLDIFYFVSDKRQLTLVTADGELTFYGRMRDLEGQLPDYFIRTHNRYYVNLTHITKLTAHEISSDHYTIPISRQYNQTVSIAFAKYMLK